MIRVQVRFTEAQMKALRRLSERQRCSVAQLVRESVDQYLAGNDGLSMEEKWELSMRAVGAFRSDRSDVAENHDAYLAEALYDWHDK